ncbi:hypothetical protein TCAL_11023 [Tigriopus californicus]|uniref:Major facilitator superfamily (MFS) profile domain-containing protein n=1 Tax=Tigriopus californicus TaxID=6832 RepID=A0A553NTW8_TIGCA|nr:major facilitator superfamily domain-containing protein 8-like [Tigriopus californicus]TRY68880.1 hypothetical protein TCAL_11023 [Tigriopus californicus]|eukprot:TCALIF_11023-PA protein Name:"Similar to mfsd8 Major facilitator superfamily domain-containing protein 8 (Xenopus laevis)" AED:0.06 eAED:0.06 QI:185/1/1/1/0.42/0.5/8/137/591
MTRNNSISDPSDKIKKGLDIPLEDGGDKGDDVKGGEFLSGQQRETKSQRRARILSIYIVHIGMFIFSLGFSIVLTGVYPYMKQLLPNFGSDDRNEGEDDPLLAVYGLVVAINPLGQMIFSPILGWVANKMGGSIRLICLFCSALYCIGNVVYSILSVFPESSRYPILMVARFLIGVSSANAAPMRSYVASATYQSERTAQLSILASFQSLGFVIGPAFQAALTPVQCSDLIDQDTWFALDMYTLSGWLSAVLGLISFVLFLPGIFKEFDVAEAEAEEGRRLDPSNNNLSPPDMVVTISCIFNFFIYLINFVILETLGTPLCIDQFGWTESEAILYLGIAMSVGGIISVICFATVGPLSKRFDERKMIIFIGLIPMIIARLIMMPFPGLPPPRSPETFNRSSPFSSYMYSDEMSTDDWSYWNRIGPQMFNGRAKVPCESESSDSCPYDWCTKIPGLNIVQFFVGFLIAFGGYPYCTALCQSIFSKALGPRPQGLWMGALTAGGSLARVLGPIFVTFVYQSLGTYATMGIVTGSMVLSLIITLLTYKRLVPFKNRQPKVDEKHVFKENLEREETDQKLHLEMQKSMNGDTTHL